MKFTVAASDLSAAMTRALRCVCRSQFKILDCVHLSASGTELTIRATDMDQFITISLAAHIEKPGEACVSADRLAWFAKGADDEISGNLARSSLALRHGERSLSLPALDVKDFPAWDAPDGGVSIVCDASGFSTLLDQTEFAQSSDKSRHYLNGVALFCEDGVLTAAAGDGKVLMLAPSDIACEPIPSMIIPRPSIIAMRGIIDAGEKIELVAGEGKLALRCGAISYSTKLVDGQFPDLRRILRPESPVHMTLDAHSCAELMARASKIAEAKDHTIYLSVSRDSVLVRATSEYGELIESLPLAAPLEGADEFYFAANSLHLGRLCAALKGEITLHLAGVEDPAMVSCSAYPKLLGANALCRSNMQDFKRTAEAA